MSNAAAQTPSRARRTSMATSEAAPGPMPEPSPASSQPNVALAPAEGNRKPFGARAQRLENPPIANYQCYWFNDLPGRIERAKEAGYEHVLDKDGKPVKKVVGVAEGGGGLVAYRMKIPAEFYQADQEAKERPRAELDASMRSSGGRDAGYATKGAPLHRTEASVPAQMDHEGRQRFNLPKA